MALVIELCRTCGFDIPVDSGECPGCAGRSPVAPPRAARQVAGLALPTRSVRRVPSLRPGVEAAPPVGPARAARSAFSFTSTLTILAVVAACAAWASTQPRFVLQVPAGTTEVLDRVAETAAVGSLVALGLGVALLLEWCTRATWAAWRSRRLRHDVDR